MTELGKPTVARVNGHALAAGVGLVASCDLAVASETAQFGTPEVNVGVFPMMVMAIVFRNLPRKAAMELMLTGKRIDAAEAVRLGLINRRVPAAQLDPEVDALTDELSRKSPIGMKLGLEAFYKMQDMSFPPAMAYLQDRIDRLRVLVPNRRGLDRAKEAGVRNIAVTVAATDGYNQHNLNRSVAETLNDIAEIGSLAGRDGIAVDSSISVAFGCPYEGTVSPARVEEVAVVLADGGIREIALADTIGVANPAQVEELFQAMKQRLPSVRWGAHFHDTRGAAMANLLAALETGVSLFEGSIGGIGGQPLCNTPGGQPRRQGAVTRPEGQG